MFTGTALAQAYPLAFVSVSKLRSAHDQNSWNVVSQKTPAGSNPASPANLGFGGVSPHLNLGWFRLAGFDLHRFSMGTAPSYIWDSLATPEIA